MKKRAKRFLVSLSSVDFDEFEVRARNEKEAARKAEKILEKYYNDMQIDCITKM